MSFFLKTGKRTIKGIYLLMPFKKHLFYLLKLFWIPSPKIYQHLYFHGIFKVKVSESHSFKIDHFGQQIENELFWRGLAQGWEKTSIDFWIKLCGNAKVILDVGANSGLYSLVAKTISPQAEVYAFEPVNRVFNRLVTNLTLNNFNVHAHEVALSNYNGEATIYDTFDNHILSVTVNKNLLPANVVSHPVKILVRKLSSFAEENKITGIDLIKIDVETHEAEVLEGMGELLTKFKPTLLIEVLNDEIGKRIQALVENLNYLFFDINEITGATQVNEIKQSSYYNYLICSESVARSIGLAK
jgi:FkbM family methyltransferase